MLKSQQDIVERLRHALQERAETISSSAQMLLSASAGSPGAADMTGIRRHAEEMYRMVHTDLAPAHFLEVGKGFEEELQRIRHDLRGVLNTILGRSQLLELEESLAPALLAEVTRIRQAARGCVEVLNQSREDLERAADVLSHELGLPPSGDPGSHDASALLCASLPEIEQLPAEILVVDDNAQSRELLERFLLHEGHTVHHAEDGTKALAFLQDHEVDLILLDLQMPGMNGFQVLERLRRAGTLACTPVIIVSGMDSDTHAVRGIELGAEDFLSRPIDLSLLRARVNAALERQRLRERELGQFFAPGLARYLLRHPGLLLEGRSMEVSVLFLDVVGFSRISERMGPAATIQWLGEAMDIFSACIQRHQGVLVDYTGDQIMALWGAPRLQPDHASLAVQTARALCAALPDINRQWADRIGAPTELTIGINTGDAFVGNVGTRHKFKYGALGNTVNLAARLQSATKYLRAPVLLSGHSLTALVDRPAARRLARLRLNNIEQPVDVFELAVQDSPGQAELFSSYERALDLFESGELHRASAQLGDILKRFPDDGPALLLLSRTVEALLHPETSPEPVWTLPGK